MRISVITRITANPSVNWACVLIGQVVRPMMVAASANHPATEEYFVSFDPPEDVATGAS
ncbi:MAG TPA: hypothetical protein PK812_05150 [Beijerinckiaceae bacterium]|nr:hypothetical protein [Beijerinckiaceae bacterium]